jgi:large subunit ribosomal protein L9
MQLILKQDVPNLGRGGDVVKVKPGYGRNYLLPRGLALVATAKNMSELEHHRKALAARAAKLRKDAESLVERLGQLSLTLERKSGEQNKLFGSVTPKDLEDALRSQGLEIDRKKIQLEEPIKSLGHYTVAIKLAPELTASLKVWVVAST